MEKTPKLLSASRFLLADRQKEAYPDVEGVREHCITRLNYLLDYYMYY